MAWLGRHRDYEGDKSQADDVGIGTRDHTLGITIQGPISRCSSLPFFSTTHRLLGSVSSLAQIPKGLLLTTGAL